MHSYKIIKYCIKILWITSTLSVILAPKMTPKFQLSTLRNTLDNTVSCELISILFQHNYFIGTYCTSYFHKLWTKLGVQKEMEIGSMDWWTHNTNHRPSLRVLHVQNRHIVPKSPCQRKPFSTKKAFFHKLHYPLLTLSTPIYQVTVEQIHFLHEMAHLKC